MSTATHTTRFAPSPTGSLHVGNARTALFNLLAARSSGGRMVLRVEDTDAGRSEERHLDRLLDDLRWLGIDWDEGPFFQMKRLERYTEVAEQLIAEGALHNVLERF